LETFDLLKAVSIKGWVKKEGLLGITNLPVGNLGGGTQFIWALGFLKQLFAHCLKAGPQEQEGHPVMIGGEFGWGNF